MSEFLFASPEIHWIKVRLYNVALSQLFPEILRNKYNVLLLILNTFRFTIYIYNLFFASSFLSLPIRTHLRYVFFICPAFSEKNSHPIFFICADHMEKCWCKKVCQPIHFIGTASCHCCITNCHCYHEHCLQ